MNRPEKLRGLLSVFQPVHLEIVDESHLHAGHPGAREGGGHYKINIVSAQFSGKSSMERHRMIYSAVGEMLKHEIHALNITANTPLTL